MSTPNSDQIKSPLTFKPVATATPEQRERCRAALLDYLAKIGMHHNDFAPEIGYNKATLAMFLKGSYGRIGGNDIHIITRINSYLAAHPVRRTRAIGGELFETANVRLIREVFSKLLLRPRAFMIYAPPGSQKTFVLENEVFALNAREVAKGEGAARAYYVYARQGTTPAALVKRVAQASGVLAEGSLDRVLDNIRRAHENRRGLLILDEAQHMSLACFEVVRELLDREPYFSLLFSGSHDLFLQFERASATFEQWNSRIARKVRLPGCTREEAAAIVQREVGHLLIAQGKTGEAAARIVSKLIDGATVADAYVAVPEGSPAATYINIRTLCNALDDLRGQYAAQQDAAAQKESAA